MMLLPLLLVLLLQPSSPPADVPWPHSLESKSISERIAPPDGFVRVSLPPASFGAFLRALPVKAGHPSVRLYNGALKIRQDVHAAVLDIDVGVRNLQQCADAVIRLRAEYLWASEQRDSIMFRFTSGDEAAWRKWADGWRPSVSGSSVRWSQCAASDSSYKTFRKYLSRVFEYAGTLSLSKELRRLHGAETPGPGDVFIQGGSPGHAVVIVDAAERRGTRDRLFLLAQSYMPAQEIHILKNLRDPGISPWYRLPAGGAVETPEWLFRRNDLRRFPD